MHTVIDDLVKWLNRGFLGREWEWPATDAEEPGAGQKRVS